MKAQVRRRLEMLGYRVTSTQEFLGLSDEEMALIDLKLVLINKLKRVRRLRNISQERLARMIGSSQSRVAMIERASPDVSLDLICRGLFALGVTSAQLARAIVSRRAA